MTDHTLERTRPMAWRSPAEANEGWDADAGDALIPEIWALRHADLCQLQHRLVWAGVSSRGHAESPVLANLDKVLGILRRIAGRPSTALLPDEPGGVNRGAARQARRAQVLFGPTAGQRAVRMMVTLPSEAAHDEALVARRVVGGMEVARINCAHDAPPQWAAMVAWVRRAAQQARRSVWVLMDEAGPKLHSGTVAAGVAVVKFKPQCDVNGHTIAPARFGLRPVGATQAVPGAAVSLGVDPQALVPAQVGDRIDLTDARGARRRLTVVARSDAGLLVACERTVYLSAETNLRWRRGARAAARQCRLAELPAQPGRLHLNRTNRLDLGTQGLGHGAVTVAAGQNARPAAVGCTLPEALAQALAGPRFYFDDRHFGGSMQRCSHGRVQAGITDARDSGDNLAADNGVNLPDTKLHLPAVTAQEQEGLVAVAQHADMVGVSWTPCTR